MRISSGLWVLAPGVLALCGVAIGGGAIVLILLSPLSAFTGSKPGFFAACLGVVAAAALVAVPVTRLVQKTSRQSMHPAKTHLWCCALAYPLIAWSGPRSFSGHDFPLFLFPGLALVGTVAGNGWALWRSSRAMEA